MASRELFLVLFLWSLLALSQGATVRRYEWEVGYLFWKPDCLENVMIGINGQFPGPTIRAKAGDTIIVELKNALHTEGVVIHWHGIRQVLSLSLSLQSLPLFLGMGRRANFGFFRISAGNAVGRRDGGDLAVRHQP